MTDINLFRAGHASPSFPGYIVTLPQNERDSTLLVHFHYR